MKPQNGEITDPPVATTATPEAPTYVHRSHSPPVTETVFCRKCLNNQHLFVASLAQYLPDDPNDPEYAVRERNYYRFRRNLEKRYPQVCADCEPKVRKQLEKSIYHAKADHLRRMLDRSAQARVLTTPTAVHRFHSAGKWLWIISLLLQLLWHILLIQQALVAHSDEIGERSWTILAARIFGLFTSYLPTPARTMTWSFWTSALCIWWNPKWVEVYKGFDQHLFGFKTYYFYQALILLLKVPAYLDIPMLPTSSASRITVQVIAHASMATFIYFLYNTALKSIRTDHSPLWELKSSSICTTPSSQSPGQKPELRPAGEQSMADILDEILGEPVSDPALEPQPFMSQSSPSDQFDHMPSIGQRSSNKRPVRVNNNNPFTSPNTRRQSTTTGFGIDGLSLSDSQPTQYEVEMDWSPTQSQHRAFSTYQPGQSQRLKFGETPTHERAGAFWAKIPPAPTTPAQRVFNPPNVPRIRQSPATATNTIKFQGSQSATSFRQLQPQAPPSTMFANPTFLPPSAQDERDTLSDLFKASFTLDPNPPDEGELQTRSHKGSYLVFGLGVCLAVAANWTYSNFFESVW